LAALGSLIVALTGAPKCAGASSEHIYSKTEIRGPIDLKNILVVDRSIQVKDELLLLNESQFVPCCLSVKDDLVKFISVSCQGGSASGSNLGAGQREIKVWGNNRRYQTEVGNNHNIAGRSVTVVDDHRPEFEADNLILQDVLTEFDGNVGPQLTFGGFPGFSDQIPSRPPQEKRKKNQQSFASLDPDIRDFKSLIVSALLLFLATALYDRGWRIVSGAIAIYAIAGFVLGLDPWSLIARGI